MRGTWLAACASMRPGTWRRRGARVLRGTVVVTAAAEIARGDPFYGVFCLVALGVSRAPAFLARTTRATIPFEPELELALLILMVSDMTLGNVLGLYARLPWYDKALHLGSALVVGAIGWIAVSALHAGERAPGRRWLERIAILLVTLGIGALWELGEYAVDRALGRTTQSAPGMAAHDDTMLDLTLDALGGVLVALLGPRALVRSARWRRQVTDARDASADVPWPPSVAG